MLVLCCFMPALFAADKQEPKNDKRVIEALDLHSYQLLQKKSYNVSHIDNECDMPQTLHFVKELADKYYKLKRKYKQKEQRNLELEAIVHRLNELLLLAQYNNTESFNDSCSSSNSTSPVALSPSLVAPVLHLQTDQYEQESQTSVFPRSIIKKLPSDRYAVSYYNDCQKMGNIPFYPLD